ncbi:hypothetical protein SAMN04488589_0508 [Methanolobus vulcani]|uniref:Uncharacterized protein n=1 Tax=Methanolobus vulcani TaxID=38026 RepID=A0A7Z7FDF2_9EURY|nr:hypothetical protein [Methanolobus vulcani]SDF43447.1 hypothetical protein SAMN04488589_0508 [Methanolobus vulcani]
MNNAKILYFDSKYKHAFVYTECEFGRRDVFFSFECDTIRFREVLGDIKIIFSKHLAFCYNNEVETGDLKLDFIDKIIIGHGVI